MSAMPSLALLPDAERLVSAFLRGHARIVALVGDRVYTAYPAKAGTTSLLLVQRVGGDVPFSQPLVVEHAQLQFDAYGGPKAAAYELAATARAVLTELEGAVRPEGNVAGVRFGTVQWLPDETFSPPRPRYVFDTTMTMRASA
jgi:hypothetical protein